MKAVHVIDSHTGGEPTRLVVDGGPALHGTLAERVQQLRSRHDRFRTAVIHEPRGSSVLVGALLQEPATPDCAAAVIFFNNVGYLGMCGHGVIGVVATLAWLGRLRPGVHRIETPAGVVAATLQTDGAVVVQNVPAWVYRAAVPLDVPQLGRVTGDVVYGGNWFFLVDWARPPTLDEAPQLVATSAHIRAALERERISGAGGAAIDHIELSAPPADPANHSRNFVLCPGFEYDRSPCGTGTSAKLAALARAGRLAPGELWRQEGVTGSVFEAWYDELPHDPNNSVRPNIRGRAWITADCRLLFDPSDPLRDGLVPPR
ncbi:MAG: proline racemase family protein [Steroidobacteraceae bacterium]|nr:proline racemase family protein [Steroidobacteraceae bacterium]MDW8257985.1 proline racemase family protein [Gammaproteobacteria bacterium]